MRAVIYSDGSNEGPRFKGAEKHPGGCAAVVEFPETDVIPVKVAVSGELKTLIGRMELMGLVTGLKYLYWVNKFAETLEDSERFKPGNIEVECITDSKYLEESAIGRNGRKSSKDLWRQFDSLGALFKRVTIEHRPRNTTRWMEEADRVAGWVRKEILAGNRQVIDIVSVGDYFLIDPEPCSKSYIAQTSTSELSKKEEVETFTDT